MFKTIFFFYYTWIQNTFYYTALTFFVVNIFNVILGLAVTSGLLDKGVAQVYVTDTSTKSIGDLHDMLISKVISLYIFSFKFDFIVIIQIIYIAV